MILFPFSLCCLHKAMEEEKRRRKQGGGKRHFLYLVQTTNPPKLVSNPRDTGTSSQPHQYSVKLIFQRLLHSLQAVLPQFLEDFWFLTIISLPVVSETKHLFLRLLNHVFKEVQFQAFQYGPCPQFVF